jgi:hypothetical protein
MSLLLSFLLLVTPVKIEHGRFNIVKDGRKIGAEEFTIVMRGSDFVIDGKATIGDVTISSKMELNNKLELISYEVTNQEGLIRVKVASPLSELQTVARGESSSTDFRFPDGGVILDNNFFHHYLVLLYRAQMGQSNFSIFVPQDMSIGSAMTQSTGPRTYDLMVGDVKMQATTAADGSLIKLTVPSANVVVER